MVIVIAAYILLRMCSNWEIRGIFSKSAKDNPIFGHYGAHSGIVLTIPECRVE